jgi:hypothetical protein
MARTATREHVRTDGKERRMLTDLGALAPSLVVCAAFLAGVFVLLRREMAPRRRNTGGGQSREDIPDGTGISHSEDESRATIPDHEEVPDPPGGRRSRD